MPPFHSVEKGGMLVAYESHHQDHSHPLIQKYKGFDVVLVHSLRPSNPRTLCFLILLHYNAVLMKSLNAETPISLVRTLWQFSEHRPSPFYFAALHFEFKACCQPGKHQSYDMAAPWLCSTEGLIFHNLLKSSPNSYQKFPWWEMLLWEGVAALWLTLFH